MNWYGSFDSPVILPAGDLWVNNTVEYEALGFETRVFSSWSTHWCDICFLSLIYFSCLSLLLTSRAGDRHFRRSGWRYPRLWFNAWWDMYQKRRSTSTIRSQTDSFFYKKIHHVSSKYSIPLESLRSVKKLLWTSTILAAKCRQRSKI